jgi:hypothetical protein
MKRGAALLLALAMIGWPCAAGPAAAQGGPAEIRETRQILVFLRMPPEHFRPGAAYGGYQAGEAKVARMRVAGRLARLHGLVLVSDWSMPLLGVDCFVMAVPEGISPEEAAARLSKEAAVAWSQAMHLFEGQAPAGPYNDPLFDAQPAAGAWALADLHRLSTGRNVRVAVVDSGVDRSHPDLVGAVAVAENFARRPRAAEQHGTGVAAVIAARKNNGAGIVGVAPQARVLAFRACWEDGRARTSCDSLSLAQALSAAIERKAQVVNMSLSGPQDMLLSKLIDIAVQRGAVVVAAYDGGRPDGGFPASHPGVVAVSDARPPGAARIVWVAPGRDVPTAQPGGRWLLVSGSSYAAAHVSGLYALLRARTPALNTRPAHLITRPGDLIDACATLFQRAQTCECGCAAATGPDPLRR